MIKVVLLDVDGVLTDGAVYVDASGKETKRVSFEDIDAFFEMRRFGLRVGFITGEDNEFCGYVQNRFRPDFFEKGCKNKLATVKGILKKEGLSPEEVCYCGDSKKDVELLRFLPVGFAPSDVPSEIGKAAGNLLSAKRGQGVLREILERVRELNSGLGKSTGTVHTDESFWTERIEDHAEMIRLIREGAEIPPLLDKTAAILIKTFQDGGQLLLCGNGGSAADAQHIAGELVSRFYFDRPGLNAEALTANVASITAVGNDYSYDRVFARQVEAQGRKGDVLFGISTSGRSRNIVLAMEAAKEKEMTTVGLTGNKQGTEIARVSDICIHVPASSTPRIQEAHLLIGHMLCEYIEKKLFGG